MASNGYNFELNREEYIALLGEMIRHTEQLQNKPPNFVPTEELIANIVKRELEFINGIFIEEITYVEGRPNLIIKYINPSDDFNGARTLGIIGSHMDVVPANPEEWSVEPFKLTIDPKDPDKLYGRGTTDCLGHVALLVLLLKQLSNQDIKLNYVLGVVLIADEECGADPSIGVAHVSKDNHLHFLRGGPVYWLDSSDVYPTVGSGTGIGWKLTVTGKRGHSGFPMNSLNPILGANYAVATMLEVFKANFPKHPNEYRYNYQCSSNMKPTQVFATEGSINQIPDKIEIRGDIRLVPFYESKKVKEVLSTLITNLNDYPNQVDQHHESFPGKLETGEQLRFDLEWLGDPYEGVYCDIDSEGFNLISNATRRVMGDMKVSSALGSLPLIYDLQQSGLDMQIIGYGIESVYHGNDEFCTFSGMANGYKILLDVLSNYN